MEKGKKDHIRTRKRKMTSTQGKGRRHWEKVEECESITRERKTAIGQGRRRRQWEKVKEGDKWKRVKEDDSSDLM